MDLVIATSNGMFYKRLADNNMLFITRDGVWRDTTMPLSVWQVIDVIVIKEWV